MAACKSTKPVVKGAKPKTSVAKPKGAAPVKVVITLDKEEKKKPEPAVESEELVATSKVETTKEIVTNYVNTFSATAQSNMREYGIPASIILAQGILESGAGRGRLALEANNHFGIKCHKEWKGETIKHDDDAAQECFRKYKHASESYRDHGLFLTSRSWYNPLFKLDKGDYKGWAKGLKKSGYATDPKYPDKLISIIQRYELYNFDNQVLGLEYDASPKAIVTTEVISIKEGYAVQKGDTLFGLSKKFNLSVEEIKKINKMSSDNLSIGQIIKIK